MNRRRVLFVSELYYPEETSTGFIVTGIAEGLSAEREVRVLCAQPTYMNRGQRAAVREQHKGVSIRRIGAPAGNKNKLLARLWGGLSLTIRMTWALMGEIGRQDLVVVLTNPPSLPFIACWIAGMKGARPLLLVHDLYPDVFVPAGLMKETGIVYGVLEKIQCQMLRGMHHVIVLGRDMRNRLINREPGIADKLTIIPNWGEIERIHPSLGLDNPIRIRHRLEDKFIIQYSGNLGRTHGISDLLDLAKRFRSEPGVHFLVVGWGAGKTWLQEQVRIENLDNITILPPCRRKDYGPFVCCCDLFFLPLRTGMEGVSVPSRTYNVMAGGRPILAACSDSAELALVIQEEEIGFVTAPGDIDGMEDRVRWSLAHPEELSAMGQRARRAVEQKYTLDKVVRSYASLLERIETTTDPE